MTNWKIDPNAPGANPIVIKVNNLPSIDILEAISIMSRTGIRLQESSETISLTMNGNECWTDSVFLNSMADMNKKIFGK